MRRTKLISSYAWDTAISLIQITNEDYGSIGVPYADRGGHYNIGYEISPASYRDCRNGSTYDGIGFRITLFL